MAEIKSFEDLKQTAEAVVAEPVAVREPQRDKFGRAYATGRRKDASARVWLKAGSGKIIINGKDQDAYFTRPVLRMLINQPFAVTNREGQFDAVITVSGGGLSGQAGAVRHGISRCLDNYEPELHTALKRAGFLTRDPRVVERKNTAKPKRAAATSSPNVNRFGLQRKRVADLRLFFLSRFQSFDGFVFAEQI